MSYNNRKPHVRSADAMFDYDCMEGSITMPSYHSHMARVIRLLTSYPLIVTNSQLILPTYYQPPNLLSCGKKNVWEVPRQIILAIC